MVEADRYHRAPRLTTPEAPGQTEVPRPGAAGSSQGVNLRAEASKRRDDTFGDDQGGDVDAKELKDIQAPLKSRYGEDPAAAMITLEAEGRLGSEAVSCSVATGRAIVEAGLHPASGGDGSFACSGEMLLQALVACAGVTLRSVAINRGVEVEGFVRAEGDLDFRGTMGVDRDAPVGFKAIRLSFDLTTTASDEELSALLRTTERCCVVLQTLTRSPEIEVTSTNQSPQTTS